MRSKVFSDLVIVYLALYVGILGKKCELVSAAVDKRNLQTAFDGVTSLVTANAFSEATALTNNVDRQVGDRITIVGTVDGLLHGFDEQNNRKWTADVGGGPLSSHHSSGNLDYSVIPATDGSLLLHSGEGMRKTSVTARMLVEQAPFATQDGLIFTSQKSSRVIGVDLGSGRVHQDVLGSVGVGVMGLSADDAKRAGMPRRGASYSRENSFNKKQRSPFLLGRTDYTLRAFDQVTGNEEFNFTYSELRPLHKGAVLLPQVRHGSLSSSGSTEGTKGSDGRVSPQPLPLPLISTPEGDLYFTDNSGQIHRTYALDYPAVSAFTVEDIGEGSMNSAVRTQVGYSVQSLRLAYRMPGTGGTGAVSACSDSENDMIDTKCINAPQKNDHMSPSGSNIIIVRSLNDGGLYALELSGEVNARNSQALSIATSPGGSSADVKGNPLSPISPSILALPGPPPTSSSTLSSSSQLSVDVASSSSSSDSSGDVEAEKEEFGAGGGSIISHPTSTSASTSVIADTSLLLKTFERLLRSKGSKKGPPSVTAVGGAARIGIRALVKMPPSTKGMSRDELLSGWIAEEETEGDNAKDVAAEGDGEAVKLSSSLIGNHFVLQQRFIAPPVKRDLTPRMESQSQSISTYEADGYRWRMGSRGKNRDRDRDRSMRSAGSLYENLGGGSGVDLAGADDVLREHQDESQPLSFVDYLLGFKEEVSGKYLGGDYGNTGGTWDNHDSDHDHFLSDGNAEGGTRSTGGFKSSPSSLPLSLFSTVTYYLHVIEMMMLRLLVFTFSVYVTLYWLRQKGIILPPPFDSVSDQLLTLLERVVLRPEVLLMRTKSFMNMDLLPRDKDREGYRGTGSGMSGDHEIGRDELIRSEDLELIQGGYTSRVGSLLLTADVLGYGSHGTVVLRGSLNGRPVAVKRMMSRFNRAADREVSLLIRSDGHPNVVRYYLRETKNEFVYLALQLCNMSLR